MKRVPKKQQSLIPNTSNKSFKEVSPSEVQTIPPVEALLQTGYSIIGTQLAKFRGRTENGYELSNSEARTLNGYIETLVKASREQRELDKLGAETNYSDEELLEYAKESVKVLEERIKNKKPREGNK